MKTFLTYITFFSLLFPALVDGQALVGPPQRRIELLESADAIMAKQQATENVAEVALISPFHGAPAQRVEAVVKAPVIPVDEPRLSDAVALENIAAQFRPVSSLVLGERRALNMGRGRTLPLGHSFTARVRNHNYTVIISEIDERGYVLRLGDAEVRRDFGEARTGVQFSSGDN
jgi:hypothetical protein